MAEEWNAWEEGDGKMGDRWMIGRWTGRWVDESGCIVTNQRFTRGFNCLIFGTKTFGKIQEMVEMFGGRVVETGTPSEAQNILIQLKLLPHYKSFRCVPAQSATLQHFLKWSRESDFCCVLIDRQLNSSPRRRCYNLWRANWTKYYNTPGTTIKGIIHLHFATEHDWLRSSRGVRRRSFRRALASELCVD